MKLNSEELGKVVDDTVAEVEKEARDRAERRVKDKVRELLRVKAQARKLATRLNEEVAKANEQAEAAQARINKIKAGDESALEDPKSEQLWTTPRGIQHLNRFIDLSIETQMPELFLRGARAYKPF